MARIPEETIEQIAAANDIVEVIGSYFPLTRAGSSYRALCPFHQEKSPSFHVNPQRQSFHCFGCGAGGSVFRFVMSYENIDFIAAAKKLADRAGVKIVEAELSDADMQRLGMRRRLLALHQEAAEWFHRLLRKTEAAASARDYLKQRGITAEVAASWKIGYAPASWDAFSGWAHEENYSAEELVASGLVKLREKTEGERHSEGNQFYDRFRDRLMFPICNDIGEVIAFSGRTLADDPAKYLNSPETMLFTKSNVLFGLHKAKRALIDKGSAIVCEGQIDLITAFESGVQNVTAPQGTAFTEKQARILKRYVEEVILCFDSDLAGQKAATRSLPALLAQNLSVRVAQMPPGHDPDSLIRTQGPEAFVKQIETARDYFDHQIDRGTSDPRFATARGKMEFAREMAASVVLISDNVLRDVVVNNVSTRLEISADDFRKLLIRSRPQSLSISEQEKGEPAPAPVKLSTTMTLLCQCALHSSDARVWLLTQPWKELATDEPEADLLVKLLAFDLRPADAASASAFMATLEAQEESIVAQWLQEKPPHHPEPVAKDCWHDLQRRLLKRRQEAIAARLRQPDLAADEVVLLQQQVLDLQQELSHIARPFSTGN